MVTPPEPKNVQLCLQPLFVFSSTVSLRLLSGLQNNVFQKPNNVSLLFAGPGR